MGVPPRSHAEKTLIILDHCMGCCNVRFVEGKEKEVRTALCPASCSCTIDNTLYDLLDASMFKCRAGIRLDYRMDELMKQADKSM